MTSFTKLCFSNSVNGLGVAITATTSTGTPVHTALAGTSGYDELWVYAANNAATVHDLILEWGSSSVKDNITLSVPALSGLTLVVPGLLLQNTAVLSAYSDVSNAITVTGYVNRIE